MDKPLSVTKHFVVFLYPGTLFAEETTKEIDSWDVDQALVMAKKGDGYKPFAFQFITRGRAADDLDSRVVERSGRYYLGGQIQTLEEVKARNDPRDSILIGNMEGNNWPRVIKTRFGNTCPLTEKDVVIPFE